MWYIWSNDPNRMSVTLYAYWDSATYELDIYRRLYPEYIWGIKEY